MKVKMNPEDQYAIFPTILLICLVICIIPTIYVVYSLLSNNLQNIVDGYYYYIHVFAIIITITIVLWIYNIYKKPKPVEATLVKIEEIAIDDMKKWNLTFKVNQKLFNYFKCYTEDHLELTEKQKYIIYIKEYNHSVYQVEDIRTYTPPKDTNEKELAYSNMMVVFAFFVFFACAFISLMGSNSYPDYASIFHFLFFVFLVGVGAAIIKIYLQNEKK